MKSNDDSRVVHIEITESQRQILILALCDLSFSRPGWLGLIREIAECIPFGVGLLEEFQQRRTEALLNGLEAGDAQTAKTIEGQRNRMRALLNEWESRCCCKPFLIGDVRDRTRRELRAVRKEAS